MLRLEGQKTEGKDGHTVAYALLEKLWTEETGRPVPPIARTDRGKPYFPGEALHFSVTHTKKYVFCALSDRPVGIDAEELTRKINLSLAEKILSPGEKAEYDRTEDKKRALLTFWVLKEASAKCSGEGLRGYPNKTDFSLRDPRVQEMMDCLVAVIEAK